MYLPFFVNIGLLAEKSFGKLKNMKGIDMISTTNFRNDEIARSNIYVGQHSVLQSTFLHLIPGGLITTGFVLLSPWLKQNHLPPLLALLIPILILLIPFELGWLYFQGFRRNGNFSLKGIVLNRDHLPRKDFFLLIPKLLAWSALTFMLLEKLDQAIFNTFFHWLPDWFQIGQFVPINYSQSVLTFTFVLFLILNGVAGPIVEELYFRGYLLPHMEKLKGWAPLFNVVLFSLYHFFSPWQFFTRILAFFPLAYFVRRKSNIYLSMVTHCLLNIGFCLLSAGSFF